MFLGPIQTEPKTASEQELIVAVPAGFRLQSGQKLPQKFIAARLVGPPPSPVVVVAGGISSDRFPDRAPGGKPGWWRGIVDAGGPIDPAVHRVLAFDFAPQQADERLTLTTGDQARLLALILDAAAIGRVQAFVGASYGGMVGLAFAEAFPDRLERLCVIAAAHRTHPMATAWRGVQRRILEFATKCGCEAEGVALARELAMTTYRTPEEFEARFSHTAPANAGGAYPVCEYLMARGREYPALMRAERWLTLSDSMDRHAVFPGAILTPTTLVGFISDRLCPIGHLRDLAALLPNLDHFHELPSLHGHDGFLTETVALAPILHAFLAERPSAASRLEPRLSPQPVRRQCP